MATAPRSGKTALRYAIGNGHAPAAEVLVRRGAALDKRTKNEPKGTTPLLDLMIRSMPEVCTALSVVEGDVGDSATVVC